MSNSLSHVRQTVFRLWSNAMWKPVVGYEDRYEVSSQGIVRSLVRTRVGKVTGKITLVDSKEMKPQVHRCGYLKVWLRSKNDRKMHFVHRIVAKAFIENPENYPQVNHIDGDKKNNVVANLQWVTGQQNIRHAFDTGLCKNLPGSGANNAKLTDDEVLSIVDRNACGESVRDIASSIGCVVSTVRNVLSGYQWSSLTGIQYIPDETNKKFTGDDAIEIVRLKSQGYAESVIAKMKNCCVSTVQKICNGSLWGSVTGIEYQPSSSRRKRLTESDVLRIVQMKSEGKSCREIHEVTGCGYHTAHNICSGKQWSSVTGIQKERVVLDTFAESSHSM
jgi:hypothetical protein